MWTDELCLDGFMNFLTYTSVTVLGVAILAVVSNKIINELMDLCRRYPLPNCQRCHLKQSVNTKAQSQPQQYVYTPIVEDIVEIVVDK